MVRLTESVYILVSNDSGASWSTTQLSNGAPSSRNRETHVSVWDKNVYVIWESNDPAGTITTYQIVIAVSHDNGKTFSSPMDLSNTENDVPKQTGWIPILYVSGPYVYVSWGEIKSGIFRPELATSTNNGTTFGNAVILTSKGSDHDVQLFANGTSVYDMYFQMTKTSPIQEHPLVVESASAGANGSWSTAVDLSQGQGKSTEVQNDQPQLVQSGNNIVATWLENLNGQTEILYSYWGAV
jgi:hypothetical protein